MSNEIYDHDTFISPFTWRYGTQPMRTIWSEVHKRKLLRRFWIALAKAQMTAGIVTIQQYEDLLAHKDDIDIERAAQIEAEIHHDLMAEIKTYAEQCPIGGSIIHLGATSMDALDNIEAVRLAEAMDLISEKLRTLLESFADHIEVQAEVPCMAFTHIQPAEPTTIGYRLA
jgi:adenylosuccinate lyase